DLPGPGGVERARHDANEGETRLPVRRRPALADPNDDLESRDRRAAGEREYPARCVLAVGGDVRDVLRHGADQSVVSHDEVAEDLDVERIPRLRRVREDDAPADAGAAVG